MPSRTDFKNLNSALLVVDVQNDFVPGGQLAVPDGAAIVPIINRLGTCFEHVILTQDWHPKEHISFASNHPNLAAFSSIELNYGRQTLWPHHCVQNSWGAALHAELNLPHAQLILRKGCHRSIDSYSAFVEADRSRQTGLTGYLQQRNIHTLYLAGLALDFCVAWSALDACAAGFDTWVIVDACRAIDLNGSQANALDAMEAAGVKFINSTYFD